MKESEKEQYLPKLHMNSANIRNKENNDKNDQIERVDIEKGILLFSKSSKSESSTC